MTGTCPHGWTYAHNCPTQPAPDLSDYERATVERIEAAPAAEESLRERVAVAMRDAQAAHGSSSFPCRCGWENKFGVGWEDRQDRHRHMAVVDAALAVMRGST